MARREYATRRRGSQPTPLSITGGETTNRTVLKRLKLLLLLNPREGITWNCLASEFIEAISVMPFSEFMNEFRYLLSELGTST